ncbi:MAG: hypothetical protein ACLP5H_21835 [Desulfomonilaceae bacterium]
MSSDRYKRGWAKLKEADSEAGERVGDPDNGVQLCGLLPVRV